MVTSSNPAPRSTKAPAASPAPRKSAQRQRKTRPAKPPAKTRAQSPLVSRSWKSSDAPAAVREFFAKSRRLAECGLIKELFSDDPVERRRAAEMARLIGTQEPGALSPYFHALADAAASWPREEWQARQYALVAAALAAAASAQRMQLVPLVRTQLDEDRIAVRAMALEAFAVLAVNESALRDEALAMIEAARRSGIAALRARARRMEATLGKPQENQ